MSRIFLSHSSKDNFSAVAIASWLNENGWDDVFLDLDPVDGIHAGERWERSLYEHAARCEAVLFLVSKSWLSSDWCRREHELARKLNKRVFVSVIDDTAIEKLPTYLTRTHQVVLLGAGEDHGAPRRVVLPGTHEEGHVTFSAEGLRRLKAGLAQAGLDPRFFAWPPANDPERAPYRGLEPLEALDAGIFFGREAPIIEVLDDLRGLREGACPRLFVLLGASGAGKSSFLRAGMLPRLARDDRNFLPLPVIRPARAAVSGENGLVAALSAACAQHNLKLTRVQIRKAVAQGSAALRPLLRDLVLAAGSASKASKPPTLLIAIDQAEELFRAEGLQEGEELLALLRDLVQTDDPAVIAFFAIRSDSYDALEHAKTLEGLSQKAFPLLPMPRGAYQMVIEGPIRRLERAGRNFTLDPSLTEALLEDLEKGGGDALPLLAFTLEQLFFDNKAAGRLSRADYEHFGGFRGAIDAALKRVFVEADKDARIPVGHDARLALLRRGLVPWLAGIDPDTKTPRRRRAPASQVPEEARPLVDLLVEQRLLTRAVDEETGVTTIEPAHEALLRQWGNLKGWLEEDFGRLVTLEGVKRAARDWDANARDSAWAAHGGSRLEEAGRLDTRPDLAGLLDATDRAYLAACRQKQSDVLEKERQFAAAEQRSARRIRIALVVSSAFALAAIVAAVFGFYQARVANVQRALAEKSSQEAEQQTVRAEQRSAILAASVSQKFTEEGALDQALLLMLDTTRVFDDKSVPDEIRIALTKTLEKLERVETATLFSNMQVFETDDALLLVNPATNDLWKLTDSIRPRRLVAGALNDGKIKRLHRSASGKEYVLFRGDKEVEKIDASTGARKKIGTFAPPKAKAGSKFDPAEINITADGLVVRDFSVSTGESSSKYVQVMDSDTGNIVVEGELEFGTTVSLKRPGGGAYAFDEKRILELTRSGDRLVAKQANLSQQDRIRVRYGDCVAQMPNAIRLKAMEEQLNSVNPGTTFNCKKVGSSYLIELTSSTSAGADRSDSIYSAAGKQTDLRAAVEGAAGQLSKNNIAWVAGLEVPGSADRSEPTRQRYAVLLNRNAYVISRQGDEDDSLLLNFRHPGAVEFARLADPDRLVVVNAESGQIFMHKFGGEPEKKLFTTSLEKIVGTETPVETLHKGTCVGYSIRRIDKLPMPDGRIMVLETGSTTEFNDKNQLRITGSKEIVVKLGEDASCVQFSFDWKRMLVVREQVVSLYDLARVVDRGTLEGAEVSQLPVKALSAFFVGPGAQIVTSSYSTRVLLWSLDAALAKWSSQELYRGDNPLAYAEPDATGERLILFEGTGSGNVQGSLYSVGAREIWYDLGFDYKWLGAAFTPNSEIVVAEHGLWKRVFPLLPLSTLAELAESQLSPNCRPPAPKQFRKSGCWPAR